MPFSIFSSSFSSSGDTSFVESWSIKDEQEPHITCLDVSLRGTWLLSASEDKSVLFINTSLGYVATILDLESCFHVLCCVWTSDRSLFVGGSNGVVYEITLNYHLVSTIPAPVSLPLC